MNKILIYYKYVDIKNPHSIAAWQRQICQDLNLTGRILIANEGINGTVGGNANSLESYKALMKENTLFGDVDFKESEGGSQFFPKMKIKVKNEIVNLSLDTQKFNAKNAGIHLTPEQVHKLLEAKSQDLVVLDTRNDYESAIGRFKDAIIPNISNFRDLPAYIDQNLDQFKDKQVLMYCTAGVRCERATAYLKHHNVAKEVFQIKGGIHRYIEKYPDGFFRGKNYVFDGRIAVKVNEDVLANCYICNISYDDYTNCINAKCNKHIIVCPRCLLQYKNTCSQVCLELINSKSTIIRTKALKSSIINLDDTDFKIFMNYNLADKTWFKTGGSAKYYIEPSTEFEFLKAIEFAKKNNLDFFVLGEGANILISDEGFDGLVIKPILNKINYINLNNNEVLVTAQAGVIFADLINYCLQNNIVGLEEFSGIPGTVGGSVFINIHYFEFLLSKFVVSAKVIDSHNGNILDVDNAWFEFGYNYSKLHNKRYYLLETTFKLSLVDDIKAAYHKGRSEEIIRHRQKRYPYANTCGSFFRNFHENEVVLESNGKKMIYSAYYLDKIGIKGQLKFGQACVSHQHANMIVTSKGATSTDIINLARAMQKRVLQKFGIMLQPECRLIGFKEYPLL